eukprot:tig00020610_g12047.t1
MILQLEISYTERSKPKRGLFSRRSRTLIRASLVTGNGIVLQSSAGNADDGAARARFELADAQAESLLVRFAVEDAKGKARQAAAAAAHPFSFNHARAHARAPQAQAECTLPVTQILPPGRMSWEAAVGLGACAGAEDGEAPPALRVAASRLAPGDRTTPPGPFLSVAPPDASGSTGSTPTAVTARSSFSDGTRSAASLHEVAVGVEEAPGGAGAIDLMGGSLAGLAAVLPPLPGPGPSHGLPPRPPPPAAGGKAGKAGPSDPELWRAPVKPREEHKPHWPQGRHLVLDWPDGSPLAGSGAGAGAGARPAASGNSNAEGSGGPAPYRRPSTRPVGMGAVDEYGLASFDPLLWEFCFDAGGEGEVYGPHSTEEMIELADGGVLGGDRDAPALVRQLSLPGSDPDLLLYPEWHPWYSVDFHRIRALARSALR